MNRKTSFRQKADYKAKNQGFEDKIGFIKPKTCY